jgi:uncharacterized membrane protein
MAFCNNCGAEIAGDKKFCPACGSPVPSEAAPQPPQNQPPTDQSSQPQQPTVQPSQQFQQNLQGSIDNLALIAQNTADETASIDPVDIEKNKTMGGLAYILFFLPLIVCPDSRYGRFHANQGLLLLGLCIVYAIIRRLLFFLFSWIWLLASIFSFVLGLCVAAIGILGLINGFSGKAKELPFIGKYRFIK